MHQSMLLRVGFKMLLDSKNFYKLLYSSAQFDWFKPFENQCKIKTEYYYDQQLVSSIGVEVKPFKNYAA